MIIGIIIGFFLGCFCYDKLMMKSYKEEFKRLDEHQEELSEANESTRIWMKHCEYLNSLINKK